MACYGGEEFAVILPGLDAEQAAALAHDTDPALYRAKAGGRNRVALAARANAPWNMDSAVDGTVRRRDSG